LAQVQPPGGDLIFAFSFIDVAARDLAAAEVALAVSRPLQDYDVEPELARGLGGQ
jgi:hypothetical protein